MAGPLEDRLPAWVKRAFLVVVAFAALAAAVLSFILGRQERDGPAHVHLIIGDGIPATFYVPGEMQGSGFQLPDPPPEGERPPVIVLGHGATVDRFIMSSLARSFTRAGLAVVTFDFRGHGSNRNPVGSGDLTDDYDQVVTWAAESPYVDPDRIVVMGHSMGAIAALEFSWHDSRPAATVALSGTMRLEGPEPPAKVLLAWGEYEWDGLKDSARSIAARLADTATEVRAVEIDGANHGSVLFTGETVKVVVDWIDDVFGTEHPPAGLDDPRLLTAILYLPCAAVLFFGVGLVVAKLTPVAALPSVPLSWSGVGVIAASLVGPLVVPGRVPSGLLSPFGDFMVGYFAVAGVVLIAVVTLLDHRTPEKSPSIWDVRPNWRELPRLALPAAVGVGAIIVLLLPVAPLFHEVLPTPERIRIFVVVALASAPLFVGLQTLVRRGGFIRAAATSIAVHAIVLAAVGVGMLTGAFSPYVAAAFIPVLAVLFGILEVYALATQGRASGLSIGVAEAVLVATLMMIVLPVG